MGTGNVAAESVLGAYRKKVSKRYSSSSAAPIDFDFAEDIVYVAYLNKTFVEII